MSASKGEHAKCPPGTMIYSRYKVIKECGCGNFSKVFQCEDIRENRIVAVKLLKREYASDANFERDILLAIKKKNPQKICKIIHLLDYFIYEQFPAFVFDEKGPSLRSCKLGVTRGHLTEHNLMIFAYEMLKAFSFLHNEVKLVHTDIKPENILLDFTSDTMGIGKAWTICDFGSASFLRSDKLDNDLITTRPYRAPEVIVGMGWNASADMWSLGCVFYEVMAGSRLFEVNDDNDHLHAFEARTQKRLPNLITKEARYSKKFFNTDGSFRKPTFKQFRPLSIVLVDYPIFLSLLLGLLEYDPKKRLTAEQAIKHPYFAKITIAKSNISAQSNTNISKTGSINAIDNSFNKVKSTAIQAPIAHTSMMSTYSEHYSQKVEYSQITTPNLSVNHKLNQQRNNLHSLANSVASSFNQSGIATTGSIMELKQKPLARENEKQTSSKLTKNIVFNSPKDLMNKSQISINSTPASSMKKSTNRHAPLTLKDLSRKSSGEIGSWYK